MRDLIKRFSDWLLDEIVRWSRVAQFMRTRIAQVGAVIPGLGYLILWSQWAEEALKLNARLSEDGTWFSPMCRLQLLYWGQFYLRLLCLFIGPVVPGSSSSLRTLTTSHLRRLSLTISENGSA